MMDELEQLHHNAKQCRALADSAMTAEAHDVLLGMAQDYELRVATVKTDGARALTPFGWVSNEPLLKSALELSQQAPQRMSATG